MANKKLMRSNNKMVAGVCAGIAEYCDLDVTLVRVLYTILTVCTAAFGVILYFILMLIMPQSDGLDQKNQ